MAMKDGNERIKQKIVFGLLAVLGGGLLVGEIFATPVLLFAFGDVMSSASLQQMLLPSSWPVLLILFFLLAYPLIYILCLITASRYVCSKRFEKALKIMAMPLAVPVIILFLMSVWRWLNHAF